MGLSERKEEDNSACLDACSHGIASMTAWHGNHRDEGQPQVARPLEYCVCCLGARCLTCLRVRAEEASGRLAKFDSLPIPLVLGP